MTWLLFIFTLCLTSYSEAKIFTPIGNRDLLSKTIAVTIEEAIRERKLLPGQKLPSEFELCEQFDVSRTAIREAIRMLNARGIVSVEKGRGVFITNVSAQSVTDPMQYYLHMKFSKEHALYVVHARQVIEPSITASAALHHTEEDAEKLVDNYEELKMTEGDVKRLIELDMAFHLDIARASENPLIPLILEPIYLLMPKIKTSVYAVTRDAKESAVIWHGKILDAILKRDPNGAYGAMVEHLKIAEEHLRKVIASSEKGASVPARLD
ncbi:MAG: FadR/GntR family transcriptional regulator [Bacteroidota bacterium]